MPMTPLELLDTDSLISEEDRAIRDTVRTLVEDKLKPEIAGWYDAGTAPVRELAKEFGSMGLLGMHLTGYGCAGTSATAYGLACLELEAGDSGLRSIVSARPCSPPIRSCTSSMDPPMCVMQSSTSSVRESSGAARSTARSWPASRSPRPSAESGWSSSCGPAWGRG